MRSYGFCNITYMAITKAEKKAKAGDEKRSRGGDNEGGALVGCACRVDGRKGMLGKC